MKKNKYKFSSKSLEKLDKVNQELKNIFLEAIKLSPLDFGISCGARTFEEQKKLLNKGASKTLKSKHLTGNAVDIYVYINGKVSWEFKHYKIVAEHIKNIAKKYNTEIIWGGDWKNFKDGCHFELKSDDNGN